MFISSYPSRLTSLADLDPSPDGEFLKKHTKIDERQLSIAQYSNR